MKILAIMGSPRRRGNSYQLTALVEELMKKHGNVEFEYLFLKNTDLKPCIGCSMCMLKGEEQCPLHDDRAAIADRMRQADGLIFVSPTYVYNVSGLMKNFIDRFAYVCHRPRYFKSAMLISTTGAGGAGFTLFILGSSVVSWGVKVAAKVGVAMRPDREPGPLSEKDRQKVEKAASRFYEAVSHGRPSPGIIDLAQFSVRKHRYLGKGEGNCDHQYWKAQGWLDNNAIYYYKVNVGPIKRAASWLVSIVIGLTLAK